ncbi:hypothetical protein DL96DRAFT_1614713 [Flagelloscypha sp. PMI_526]|nr:hypothetical protein DL96DRAFT_1614713 [Flagelloscypha sp. PMI_526]
MLDFSSGTNQTYCQEIDEEIARRTEEFIRETRALRLKRNQASITYHIPTEILATIFRHVGGANLEGLWSKKDLYAFIPCITHICSLWRTVALADTLLWTTIRVKNNPVNLERTIALLERSGTAQLSVYCPTYSYCEPLLLTLQHSNRIADLRIYACPQASYPQIGRMLACQSWPILHTLDLDEVSRDRIDTDGLAELGASLGQVLSRSPHLQVLGASSLPLRASGVSPTLTRLSVGGRMDDLSFILELLRETPNLTSLELSELLFSGGIASREQVPLPHLQELSILGTDTACVLFVQYLLVSESSPLAVTADLSCTSWSASRQVAEYLTQFVYPSPDEKPVSPEDVEIQFHEEEVLTILMGSTRSIRLALSNIEDVQTNTLELLPALLSPALQALTIRVRDFLPLLSWSTSQWVNMLSAFPLLSKLKVCGDHQNSRLHYPAARVPHLYAALGSGGKSNELIDGKADLRFPNLKKLIFANIAFDSKFSQFQKLADSIEERHNEGIPLEQLRLFRCSGVVEQSTTQLRETCFKDGGLELVSR